ncbi:MAG: energy-coupling factor ABC transporter permease [Spirochaetaceae bacterium]|jgi:cobalt/nickel transport system permease protein|nr:energy-coupling factor ABC transporter permease [Spirochaetaceae bacterium]
MHISEGVLSLPVIAGGWALGAAGVAVGLKKTPAEEVPKTALVSAALFLASLVHVPVGPSSIHLTLLGLAGYLLGWSAVPALFAALLLQGLLFQFGGLLSLGANTTIMGAAALAGYAMRLLTVSSGQCVVGSTRSSRNTNSNADDIVSTDIPDTKPETGNQKPATPKKLFTTHYPLFTFLAGFLAVIAGSSLVVLALVLSAGNLRTTAALIFAANVPLALVEGALTLFIMLFLLKVKPDVLKRA